MLTQETSRRLQTVRNTRGANEAASSSGQRSTRKYMATALGSLRAVSALVLAGHASLAAQYQPGGSATCVYRSSRQCAGKKGKDMDTPNSTGLLDHFKELEDPRVERTREYKLLDIILIAGVRSLAVRMTGWTSRHGSRTILDQGVDYVLSLKQNQGHLYQDTVELFAHGEQTPSHRLTIDYAKTINKEQRCQPDLNQNG